MLIRRTRVQIVVAVAGALGSILIAPNVVPAKFNHLTEMGYIVRGGASPEEVMSESAMSADTWQKVVNQCIDDTVEQIDISNSVSGLDGSMQRIGFNFRIICRTHANRTSDWLAYALAALVMPLLLLMGTLVVGWVMKGEREQQAIDPTTNTDPSSEG